MFHQTILQHATHDIAEKVYMELEATQLSPQGQWWGATGSSQYGGQPKPLFLFREIANLALFHLIHLDEDIWGRG